VLLKHYAFSTESVINAILENNLPPHLEKYKTETLYSQAKSATSEEPEKFYKGKWKTDASEDMDKVQLKDKIYESLSAMQAAAVVSGDMPVASDPDDYVDSSLLPSFYGQNEYEDEYDDTYDESGMGTTEPDEITLKPLNKKMAEFEDETNGHGESEDEMSIPQKPKDAFVEDPAVVRERLERRRAEKAQQKRHHHVHEGQRDVVGKAKGQGQDKEVVLNRRHKTMHSNEQRRKGADRKRNV